ncbi:MAG: hypothetical protein JW765_06955 [Deltaproteobacteria bacterium]|nr:hypothetical protein [Candidatus Zymogenaceae bacterium]
MKRPVLSAVILLILFVVLPLFAADMPDTTGAREGKIRGSVGIGPGTVGGSSLIVFPIAMPWIDTGIDVADGDIVTIAATPAKNHPPCDGRTGCPPYREADAVIVDGALGKGLTALVGRVGTEGKPFSIGEKYDGSVPGTGRLYLGYNDCWACWGNNTGAFDVTIAVKRNNEEPE